jgi:hypothetical protein
MNGEHAVFTLAGGDLSQSRWRRLCAHKELEDMTYCAKSSKALGE